MTDFTGVKTVETAQKMNLLNMDYFVTKKQVNVKSMIDEVLDSINYTTIAHVTKYLVQSLSGIRKSFKLKSK